MSTVIIGAGMSGAIAAALDREAEVLEAATEPPSNSHRAVLRFRTDRIGQALNIPFRRVRVLKAVACDGALANYATPRAANLYARKVTGTIQQRSIGDLSPVDRFIAPEDFHAQLLRLLGSRVHYGSPLTVATMAHIPARYISTIPLNQLCRILDIEHPPLARAPIHVTRFDVADCDVFQTVYFPDPATPIYRASLTGSLLIVEATSAPDPGDFDDVAEVFGLDESALTKRDAGEQRYGKITPLPDAQRKALLHHLTEEFGIFSLGRFATWRNILLDDVYDDYFKVRAMMALDSYDLKRSRV